VLVCRQTQAWPRTGGISSRVNSNSLSTKFGNAGSSNPTPSRTLKEEEAKPTVIKPLKVKNKPYF